MARISDINTVFRSRVQLPLDVKTYFPTKQAMKDSVLLENRAIEYYEGMIAYVAEDNSFWLWTEIDGDIMTDAVRALDNDYIYDSCWKTPEYDYSNKRFNFIRLYIDSLYKDPLGEGGIDFLKYGVFRVDVIDNQGDTTKTDLVHYNNEVTDGKSIFVVENRSLYVYDTSNTDVPDGDNIVLNTVYGHNFVKIAAFLTDIELMGDAQGSGTIDSSGKVTITTNVVDSDMVDGKHAADLANVDLSNVDDTVVLNKVKNVDGDGSGLDSDMLDGQHWNDVKEYIDNAAASFAVNYLIDGNTTNINGTDYYDLVTDVSNIGSGTIQKVIAGSSEDVVARFVLKGSPQVLLAGYYVMYFVAEVLESVTQVRMKFRIYELFNDGTQNLLSESELSSKVISRKDHYTIGSIIEQDVNLSGDYFIIELIANNPSSNSKTVVIYYDDNNVLRFVVPTTVISLADTFVKRTEVGAADGVAPLGSDMKVPAAYLPSFVDDVLEYPTQADFPATGETGKIYVAKDTGKIYRWTGTEYIEISPQETISFVDGTYVKMTPPSGFNFTIDDSQIGTELNKKADKVNGAIENNLASLDSTGNLQDSGYKADDFALKEHTHDNIIYTGSETVVDVLSFSASNGLHVTFAETQFTANGQFNVVRVGINEVQGTIVSGVLYVKDINSGNIISQSVFNESVFTDNDALIGAIDVKLNSVVQAGQYTFRIEFDSLTGIAAPRVTGYSFTHDDSSWVSPVQDSIWLYRLAYVETVKVYVNNSGVNIVDTVNGNVDNLVNVINNKSDIGHTHVTSDITDLQVSLDGKADKVDGAVNGNIASLDANGNLQDSGIASSDIELTSNKGQANGYAPLDNNSYVPIDNLDTNAIKITPVKTYTGYSSDSSYSDGISVEHMFAYFQLDAFYPGAKKTGYIKFRVTFTDNTSSQYYNEAIIEAKLYITQSVYNNPSILVFEDRATLDINGVKTTMNLSDIIQGIEVTHHGYPDSSGNNRYVSIGIRLIKDSTQIIKYTIDIIEYSNIGLNASITYASPGSQYRVIASVLEDSSSSSKNRMYTGRFSTAKLFDANAGGILAYNTSGYGINTYYDEIDFDGDIYVPGTVKYGNMTQISDIRLKEIIGGIDNIDFNKLKPIKYYSKLDGKIHYGFIAQELEDVSPILVSITSNGYYSYDPNAVLALAVAEIKKLKEQIESIKTNIFERIIKTILKIVNKIKEKGR